MPFVPGSIKLNQGWIERQDFSAKEREILDLLVLRYSPQQIALLLNKAKRTVQSQILTMVHKAHVANREELVGLATEENAQLESGLRIVRSA